MIRSMEWGNISISIRLNTMVSGRMMFAKAMELITILMAIGMRENGIRICKMEVELITTLMEIYIKANG
jgi:hypothetical protein